MKKPYIQFSKRIVISVCACVTLVVCAGIFMAFFAGEISQITQMVKTYIEYAMVVFAAYSGNSAVEKWLIHRTGAATEKEEENSNG